MATISAQLRNFKEPDKDGQTLLFFSIPNREDETGSLPENAPQEGSERMEISAVLSMGAQSEEDAYVRELSTCHLTNDSGLKKSVRPENCTCYRRISHLQV